jgi:hypothetical protein
LSSIYGSIEGLIRAGGVLLRGWMINDAPLHLRWSREHDGGGVRRGQRGHVCDVGVLLLVSLLGLSLASTFTVLALLAILALLVLLLVLLLLLAGSLLAMPV